MDHGPRKIGVTSADRIFMRVGNFTFRVRQGEFEDAGVDPEDRQVYTEAGDMGIKPIWLGFVKRRGRFYVELTGMTTEELDAFERGMTSALAAAREVVTYLDEHADSEYDDDTPMIPLRALKTPPIVIHREIRPFIGTEIDPIEDKAAEKVYDASFSTEWLHYRHCRSMVSFCRRSTELRRFNRKRDHQ